MSLLPNSRVAYRFGCVGSPQERQGRPWKYMEIFSFDPEVSREDRMSVRPQNSHSPRRRRSKCFNHIRSFVSKGLSLIENNATPQ